MAIPLVNTTLASSMEVKIIVITAHDYCTGSSSWQCTVLLITGICFPVNALRPRQDGCHFPDDIFKCIFLNENAWILFTISLNFLPKGPINNIPALVQIMAWHQPGDKPLSEPRMLRLSTHICVIWPQWVKNGLNIGNMVVCVSRHGLCITTKCGIGIGIGIKKITIGIPMVNCVWMLTYTVIWWSLTLDCDMGKILTWYTI